MKVKLLKKLRKKFAVWYCPARKIYKLYTQTHILSFRFKKEAKKYQRDLILSHGREFYSCYSKNANLIDV